MTKICGVYLITCTANGKSYVGSSCDVYRRWSEHRKSLNASTHANRYLQRCWNKYSEESFEFCILEECNRCDLIVREIFWISYLQADINSDIPSTTGNGMTRSAETCAKISKSKIGHEVSHATREKLREANTGKKLPPGTIAKVSAANTGKRRTDDFKARQAVAATGNKYGIGKTHNMPPESRAKMSVERMGKRPSEETRTKMSEAQTGRKHSDETKAKMAEARAEYWRKKKERDRGEN
jgi:group I intron endonuclease